jgi:prepilin-type N-terminal cleavage/methylation domain-containing protein
MTNNSGTGHCDGDRIAGGERIAGERIAGGNPIIDASRGGFSLVECIVAMVMLSVVVSSLAMLTTYTAQKSLGLANISGRQAYGVQEMNRVLAMKYDTIPQMANGCDTVQLNTTFKYSRCLSYTQASRYREVKIIVTPLRLGTYADTIIVRRANTTVTNPLNMP